MYVFYADVFVFQNFLINVIVLLCGAGIRKIHRLAQIAVLVLMALVGSVLELLLLLVNRHYWYFTLLSYVIVIPFVTVIALKVKNFKDFLKCYISCLAAVILLGGSTEALENLFGVRQLPFLVILAAGVTIAMALERFLRFKRISQKMLPVMLQNGGKKVEAFALYDTGNRLREPYQGKAVHIITPEIAKQLGVGTEKADTLETEETEAFGAEETGTLEAKKSGTLEKEKLVYSVYEMEQAGMLSKNQRKPEARVIPYSSLGSTGLLVIYTLDELKILESGMEQVIAYPVVGIARPELMKNKNYQIILNQEVDI